MSSSYLDVYEQKLNTHAAVSPTRFRHEHARGFAMSLVPCCHITDGKADWLPVKGNYELRYSLDVNWVTGWMTRLSPLERA